MIIVLFVSKVKSNWLAIKTVLTNFTIESMIEVSFEKAYYFPSETVHGKIKIYSRDGCWLNNLYIRFQKNQRVTLKNICGAVEDTLYDQELVLSEKTIDLCKNIELKPGYSVFPFYFRLKSTEGSTGLCKNYFDDIVSVIENNFIVQAIGIIDKEIVRAIKCIPIITLLDTNNFVDIKIKQKSLLCLYQRTSTYRIKTNKSWYFKGDTVFMDCYSIDKLMGKTVKDVSCNLYQLVKVANNDMKIEKSRLMGSYTAVSLKNNHFVIQFKLPLTLSPNMKEEAFSLRTQLVFYIHLQNGSTIKASKFLNIGYFNIEIPSNPRYLHGETIEYQKASLECY